MTYDNIFLEETNGRFSSNEWEFQKQCLPEHFKRVYEKLVKNIEMRANTADMSEFKIKDISDINLISTAIRYDHPLLFDFDIPSYIKSENILSVNLKYNLPDNDFYFKIHKIVEKIMKIYCELGSSLAEAVSDFDIVKIVHDYLIKNIVWCENEDELYEHSILGALLTGKGVCDSIAYAVSALLNAYHVKCSVISGKTAYSDDNTGHAWNIVEINGHRGHLDVGWDVDWNNPIPHYDYFLISDEECKSTERKWDIDTNCDGEYQYFKHKGLCAADQEDLTRMISRFLETNENIVHIKTWNGSTETGVCDILYNTLKNRYGNQVNHMKPLFQFDDSLKIITFRIRR